MNEPSPDAVSDEGRSLREQIGALEWYHTIELAPGVITPGWFDTRSVARRFPMPGSLSGRRCLDVGTFDGFWAFEMERRGASEVVAIDVLDPREWDWPAGSAAEVVSAVGSRKGRGEGFLIAHRALGSKVERRERSVYQLDPEEDGMFDFVYVGSLLLHLHDPIGALRRVRTVCSGQALVVDAIDLGLTLSHPRRPTATLDARGRPWWWKPNLAALVRMLEAAGFASVGEPRRCFMPPGPGQRRSNVSISALMSREGRDVVVRQRWGDPHGIVLARPV